MTRSRSFPRSRQAVRRRRAERRGRHAENWAALWLQLKGYRILARRYRSGMGEIDVIARRGGVVAFVEVKHRPKGELSVDAVTYRAQQRIAKSAAAWTSRVGLSDTFEQRFDIVLVSRWGRVRHIRDAWRGDDVL